MKVNKGFTAIVFGWFVMMGLASCRVSPQTKERPNIVLILADDMGFSDLGCYGSGISTPNLDSLAYGGLRYTQFYNGARCCPSRACLMTGLYPHQAGLGWMTTSRYDLPGYRDELNDSCVTIAEVLRASGYHTYMTGKWHLCHDITPQGPRYDWPLQRGFEKFYGIPFNTITQIKAGTKRLGSAYWHIIYERIKPAYGVGFIGDYSPNEGKKRINHYVTDFVTNKSDKDGHSRLGRLKE